MTPFGSVREHPLAGARTGAAVSEFLWKTYRWMSIGLALTGFVAFLVASSPGAVETILHNRGLFFVLLIGEFLMVVAFSAAVARVSFSTAALMFLSYAALNGLTFSVIFLLYTHTSIAQVFFISAGAFAGLSVYGATTKRDLTAVGRFMFMALIGVIIASVVNYFLSSPALYWLTTYSGVIIFAGLTAYDTQRLKAMFSASGETGNLALRGALMLYLDFINMFLFLLRLFGNRR